MCPRPAVILAITLYVLYTASAWVMLRSVNKPRLEPLAWALILLAIVGHGDAIMHMMRINGPFSIGLLEATSLLAWTLAVLACLISIERQNRALGALSCPTGQGLISSMPHVGQNWAVTPVGGRG